MGVYIPNMEMPKNCFQCSFNDGIYCALIDNDTDAFISEDPTKVSTKRLDNCPLIEIDLERDIPTIWHNRQTGQFEPKGTKQEVYKRIYKLQNGGRIADDYTIKANK